MAAFGMRAKSVVSVIGFGGMDDDDEDSSSESRDSTMSRKASKKSAKKAVVTAAPSKEGGDHLAEKPSPLNFDQFLPWACAQWMCPHLIAVHKKRIEIYAPVTMPKKKALIRVKSKQKFEDDESVLTPPSPGDKSIVEGHKPPHSEVYMQVGQGSLAKLAANRDDIIVVRTFYDSLDRLIEISIVKPPFKVPIEIFRAINISLNYHTSLNKLTFRRGVLTANTLYFIGTNILPESKITEVCLDDTFLREGNFYVLLEYGTHLKHLSLNRCRINDVVVEKITNKMKAGSPAADKLIALEMASNNITDVGACFIANILRRDRTLLHLNLSGNRIGDAGAMCLLNTLMEFTLNEEEVYDLKCRRFKYFKHRLSVYNNYFQEQIKRREKERSLLARKDMSFAMKKVKSKKSMILDEYDYAEMMTNQLVGEGFLDVYDDNHVIFKKGKRSCTGNFRLASLNLAYNNFRYFSVKVILKVLQYQSIALKAPHKGLVRILYEGNDIPHYCYETEMIQMYLKRLLVEPVLGPTSVTKRRGSSRKDSKNK